MITKVSRDGQHDCRCLSMTQSNPVSSNSISDSVLGYVTLAELSSHRSMLKSVKTPNCDVRILMKSNS